MPATCRCQEPQALARPDRDLAVDQCRRRRCRCWSIPRADAADIEVALERATGAVADRGQRDATARSHFGVDLQAARGECLVQPGDDVGGRCAGRRGVRCGDGADADADGLAAGRPADEERGRWSRALRSGGDLDVVLAGDRVVGRRSRIVAGPVDVPPRPKRRSTPPGLAASGRDEHGAVEDELAVRFGGDADRAGEARCRRRRRAR